MERVIVGSRESRLAIMQAEIIINQLLVREPKLVIERRTFPESIETANLQSMEVATSKEVFVKDLEQALSEGIIDLAVYSLKDMPLEVPEELPIVALTEREDARDVLLLREGVLLENDLHGLVIGTSSLRRKRQMEALYKSVKIKELTGSIISRINKMDEGEYDGIILAAAGVKRAGFESRIVRYFTEEEIVPAAGQGILAVQARRGFDDLLLKQIDQEESRIAAMAERAYVRELGGECHAATGAYACLKNNKLYLTGMYYEKKSGKCYKESVIGYKNEAEKLGIFFANYMRRRYRP